jgi:hypothetical protein
MEQDPQLWPYNPIEVNEHNFILDGQHRFLAAKELGLPIYYIINWGGSLSDTRKVNSTQKGWTLLDFARSYADSGREAYKVFLRMYEKYPKITPSILRDVLSGARRHNATDQFRRGEFEVNLPESEAHVQLQFLTTVSVKLREKLGRPMASALIQLIRDDNEFDPETLLKKMDIEHATERLVQGTTVRQNIRSIEDVYNFRSQKQTRLY